jgi:hypothetical protein
MTIKGGMKISMKIMAILTLLICLSLLSSCKGKSAESAPPKVLIHYMGWYGDTVFQNNSDSLRHWKYGHANEPLIGLYDSRMSSVLTYHVLLSWACGIDGIIINVKDSYDESCMKVLMKTINSIREIDSVNFKYEFAISYDDQGFDLSLPLDTAITKLTFLRDSILPVMNTYLRYNNQPLVFCFDYPHKYITASGFRNSIDSSFFNNRPLLLWNTIEDGKETNSFVGGYYPWVQPGASWDKQRGLNWGKGYLDYYYPKVNQVNIDHNFSFTCGGVWPGFDDRKNTSWGDKRLIDRQNGAIYDSTWSYIHLYNSPLPLKFVVIETWNDWNEGTEIEPSVEDGFKYLDLTAENIDRLKGIKYEAGSFKYKAALSIYRAASLIENKLRNYEEFNPILNDAIAKFLNHQYNEAVIIANKIILI